MTDKEIIKALGICNSLHLRCGNGCPYYEVPYKNGKRCSEMMIDDALDLINRQKAENERLKNLVDGMSVYFPSCIDCDGKTTVGVRTDKCVYLEDDTNYCAKRGIDNISRILKENETLKAENERLEFSNEHWNDWEVKCRAIVEFADRLKEKITHIPAWGSVAEKKDRQPCKRNDGGKGRWEC